MELNGIHKLRPTQDLSTEAMVDDFITILRKCMSVSRGIGFLSMDNEYQVVELPKVPTFCAFCGGHRGVKSTCPGCGAT